MNNNRIEVYSIKCPHFDRIYEAAVKSLNSILYELINNSEIPH